MSPAYFESEWGTAEHHTLLFRDPTNAQRRFIPLLIADCTPPDIIAQFAHIDGGRSPRRPLRRSWPPAGWRRQKQRNRWHQMNRPIRRGWS
jgi:hypothetical protein